MKKKPSRREAEIMDILHRLGRASARQVESEMRDAPSYSTVRSTLSLMEDKGMIKRMQEGPRYLYRPASSPRSAQRNAVKHLLETFFSGSRSAAISTLLELPSDDPEDEELREIHRMIDAARRERRQ